MTDSYQLGAISDGQYGFLMEALLPVATTFGFVVSWSMPNMLATTGRLLETLQPDFVRLDRTNKWPGTYSYEVSRRYLYDFNLRTRNEIVDASVGLYQWRHPHLPRDLHLLRLDGSAVLTSRSTHRESWLSVSPMERELIESAFGLSHLFTGPRAAVRRKRVRPLGDIALDLDDNELRDKLLPKLGRLNEPDRSNVAQYLQLGRLAFPFFKSSRDVIGDSFRTSDGKDLMTDGVLYWRGDLQDYVATYGLEIDAAEVERMRSLDWVPEHLDAVELSDIFEYLRSTLDRPPSETNGQ